MNSHDDVFLPVALILVDEELQDLKHPSDAHDEEQLEAHDQPAERVFCKWLKQT